MKKARLIYLRNSVNIVIWVKQKNLMDFYVVHVNVVVHVVLFISVACKNGINLK